MDGADSPAISDPQFLLSRLIREAASRGGAKQTLYAEQVQVLPRILGLDIGDRRIGVALSDPTGSTAHPLLTIGRSHLKLELKNLTRLIRKHGVAEIVAGNPLHMSGRTSPQAEKAQAFAAALRDASTLPVHLQDERLTSAAANELLDRLGHPRGPSRKAVLDQYAAVVILQDWLDARARSAGAERTAAEAGEDTGSL